MTLLSVTYQVVDTFEEAEMIVGADTDHGDLVPPPNGEPPPEPPWVKTGPSFVGHCVAAIGIAAANAGAEIARVLDFGGGAGDHYRLARTYFSHQAFEWTVLERPNYVEYGRRYCNTPGLAFVDHIEETLPPAHLAYLSGILQFSARLDDFLSPAVLRSPFVFTARAAVSDRDICYVQTATYSDRVNRFAGRIFSRQTLYDHMETAGFEPWATWALDVHVAGAVHDAPSIVWRRRA